MGECGDLSDRDNFGMVRCVGQDGFCVRVEMRK